MGNQPQQLIYSVPLEGTQQKGFSHIYRNPYVGNKPLPERPDQNIRTMKDVHVNTYKKYPSRPALGKIIINKKQDQTVEKTISSLTYKEAFERAQAIGSAILHLRLYSDAEDNTHSNNKTMKFIGIYAKNCQQWGLCDIACATYGITSVPLYDTLGIENLSYCLNHTKMTSCFCSPQTATVLLKLADCGSLENMILFEYPSEQILQDLRKKFKRVMHFDELISQGKQNMIDYNKIQIEPNDCYTFSYTSGTTGPPKGAMLSHKNFTALINSVVMVKQIGLNENDRYLSFLPLPHVMQRAITQAFYYAASFVCFYAGDNLKLKEDAQLAQPTVFIAVPKIYSKIQEAVKAKVNEAGGIKKCLFDRACNIKQTKMHRNGECTDWLYDRLVFKNTKESFGGRIRVMLSGSAPIKPHTHQFMKTILAAPLLQGYGQTEHVAGGLIQKPYDPILGHVGGLIAGLQLKLADIPEMNYFSTDVDEQNRPTPRGQIWFRGPQVFLGYYKDEKKTKQAVNEEGWLKTGDVGMMMPNTNGIKIIDRIKNIFKLQQGQYIAPQKIESIYAEYPLLSEIVVHGESTHSFAVAILNPNKQNLIKLADSHGIKNADYEALLKDKQLRQLVTNQLNNIGKKAGLYGFQQAKNIQMVSKSFQDYDLFTNTLKLQRFKVKKVFSKEIQQMYNEGQLKLK